MLVFSAALLMAAATGCLAWYFLHLREVRSSVSHRLAAVPQNLSFPYNLNATEEPPPISGMTLEESFENKLTRKLYLAGIRSKKAVFYFQWLHISSILAPIIILVIGSLSGLTPLIFFRALVTGFSLYFLPHFYIRMRRNKIIKQITKTLPQILDLIIVSVEAGLNFTAALPRVLNEMDPADMLIKEFRLMNHEYLGGLAFSQACQRMEKRSEVTDLSLILNAVMESDQTGSSLANVLRVHAHELRDRYRQRLREKAHRIPVKLLFPMMLIFITIFFIALGPSMYRLQTYYEESLKPNLEKQQKQQDKKAPQQTKQKTKQAGSKS